jgi:hypothetical protein
MGMASANPLVRTWAPDIDSRLEARMTCEGLSLTYNTDGFPSHGVRISVDGNIELTKTVNDASWKEALGSDGLLTVLMGLTGLDYASGSLVYLSRRWSACNAVPAKYPEDAKNPTSVPP